MSATPLDPLPELPEPVEGELLSAGTVWWGHLLMELVRTIALVVIAIALVVIA